MAQSYYGGQMHLFPPNPYPQPPPPPAIAHKVWILDCRSCGTFLTNRAMKAVLLLRPNVSLFSSDALPVNCSAYSANPDALRFRTPCRSSSSAPSRTCECLTQTLCCHGCGATIGYMIVIPCARCTSSVSANNRATNGHRFVFHSTEVVGTERHYVHDEPGVIPYEPVYPTPYTVIPPERQSQSTARDRSRASPSLTPSPSASPEPDVDRIPTPTLEPANPLAFPPYLLASSSAHDSRPPPRPLTPSRFYTVGSQTYSHYHTQSNSYPYLHTTTTTTTTTTSSRPTTPPFNSASEFESNPISAHISNTSIPGQNAAVSGGLPEQKDFPTSRALKPGDLLFWHHLVRSGEIPGAEDDKRARSRCGAAKASYDDDEFLDIDALSIITDLDSNVQEGVTHERRGVMIGKVSFGR